jgi:primosomal protein N' (replication factor Y)
VIRALAAGDSRAFYAAEIDARRAAGLPPFGRLAAIIVSAVERAAAETHARGLARLAPDEPGVTVLGPAEAAMAVVRGRHRFRLLAMAPRGVDLQAVLRTWLARAPKPAGSVRVQVDVDPQSFM